jgi:hypothetical protein
MSLIHKLEPRLGRYAEPHLTLGLIRMALPPDIIGLTATTMKSDGMATARATTGSGSLSLHETALAM